MISSQSLDGRSGSAGAPDGPSGAVTWVPVPGGACRYGDARWPVAVPDLLWTRTPLTRHQLRDAGPPSATTTAAIDGAVDGQLPLTGLDWAAAARAAAMMGGRLPRAVEWEWMAAGPAGRRWPWGDAPWAPERARLRLSGHACPGPVGAYPAGATPDGLLDVAGNVWEWTASAVLGCGYQVRGGSYASLPDYARCTFINAAPAELRSPGIGVRVVRAA